LTVCIIESEVNFLPDVDSKLVTLETDHTTLCALLGCGVISSTKMHLQIHNPANGDLDLLPLYVLDVEFKELYGFDSAISMLFSEAMQVCH
jgi:hypothetical protein